MTILSDLPAQQIIDIMSDKQDESRSRQVREHVFEVYLTGQKDEQVGVGDASPWMEKDGELIAAEQCLLAWGRRDAAVSSPG